jgi:hypothetical protein
VHRAYGFGVGAVELLASLAAHANQPDVPEHSQVLGNGGLVKAEGCDDLSDGPLISGEIVENLSPARFGNRVERIGSGARPGHVENITFPYGNMSRGFFVTVRG